MTLTSLSELNTRLQSSTAFYRYMALRAAVPTTSAAPLRRPQVPVALPPRYEPSSCASWWVPFMDMRTIACASWTGILCTSRVPETRRVKAANMFFQRPMSWPEVHDMRHGFIGTKRSRNISCFGIKTNMRRSVRIVHPDICCY